MSTFDDDQIEQIKKIGEDNLTWAAFASRDPDDPYARWHVYDKTCSLAPNGLPLWSVAEGQSYHGGKDGEDAAVATGERMYDLAISILNEGPVWGIIASKPEPEPEPIYELGNAEPVGTEDPIDALARLEDEAEEAYKAIEDRIKEDEHPKGIFRRRTPKSSTFHLG